MAINLEKMSKDELKKLKRDVDKALKTIDARRKAEAKKAAETAAKEYGFSLDELLSGSGKSKSGKATKGAAKYRNPDEPSQTWTGRGRKPNWVIAAIENGTPMEKLEI